VTPRKSNSEYQSVLADAIDAALAHRVRLHAERQAGELHVEDYLSGLAAVRKVEALLEPLRVSTMSRALELTLAERVA
jgi:hypothetical protein